MQSWGEISNYKHALHGKWYVPWMTIIFIQVVFEQGKGCNFHTYFNLNYRIDLIYCHNLPHNLRANFVPDAVCLVDQIVTHCKLNMFYTSGWIWFPYFMEMDNLFLRASHWGGWKINNLKCFLSWTHLWPHLQNLYGHKHGLNWWIREVDIFSQ